MRILKVEKYHVILEINYDDIGALHYALYDYLIKIEDRLKQKDRPQLSPIKLQALKDNLQSMIETINGVI